MAVRKRRDVRRALKKKGFVLESERDHEFYFYVLASGKKTSIFTKISTGNQYTDLGDKLIAAMSRQLKLSKGDFLDLVDCPLTGADYREFLEAEGLIGT